MPVCQDADKLQEIIIIVKRFSCPHDHNVVDSLACDLLDLIDLSQHFRGRQIPLEASDR